MKSLLVLSFYFSATALVSGRVLRETSLLLRPQATNTQNQSQKVFILNPQAGGELKIGNLMYLKHLMELRCLKRTMENIRNQNQLRYQQSHTPLEVSLTQNLQNQISNVKKTRLNPSHIKVQNKVNPGNNQIIFLHHKGKFLEEDINKFLKNKEFQPTKSEVILNDKSNNFNEKRQKSKFIQPPLNNIERRINNEYFATENLRLLLKNEGNSDATKNHYETKKPNNVKSSPPTNPDANLMQQQVRRLRPYGVKAFFSEDLFNQKNSSDFKNHQFNNQNYLESFFLRRKQERKAKESKLPGTNGNNSKNLVTLAKSGNSSTFLLKEIFNNTLSHNSHRGIYPDYNNFSNLEKKTVENKFLVNFEEQKKQLENALPHSSEMIKNFTEKSMKPELETNSTSTTKVENVKKVFAIKATNAPPGVLKSKYLIENKTKNSVENLKPTTIEPEIRTYTSPKFFDKVNLDEPNGIFKYRESNTPTSFPLISTENNIKKFIREKTVTVSESSSTFLLTSSKSQTTEAGLVISKFPKKDSSNKTAESLENAKKIETETDLSEEGLTELIFTEFTDRPSTVDFLITNKKEQETFGKNSRKMHFNQKFLTTAVPDYTFQPKNLEERRSDILIDDLEDNNYLQESVFSSNYMKQLKQNNNLNSSSEFIIQLIPFVINDLRENKISSEDLPILSKAFGRYWPTVLTLTNSTNLDMLPLLKMKNEKDLNVILSTFFPEISETSYFVSAELKEADRDKFLAYYYEDDYKDLSMEQREYWKNEETFKRDLEGLRYFKNVPMERIE